MHASHVLPVADTMRESTHSSLSSDFHWIVDDTLLPPTRSSPLATPPLSYPLSGRARALHTARVTPDGPAGTVRSLGLSVSLICLQSLVFGFIQVIPVPHCASHWAVSLAVTACHLPPTALHCVCVAAAPGITKQ